MTDRLKIGVLVSGSGTNLQAIIDACAEDKISAEVKVVVSDNKEAYALTRAKKAGIPTHLSIRKNFPSKQNFEEDIIATLKEYGVELVCLAGFMRIISPAFLKQFPGRMINIHPALLPSFPGLHAQRQAVDYGVRYSGCSVHFVDEGTDTGPIILQAVVPVSPDDTEETLSARILKEEHRIYPQAIDLFAKGRLEIVGRCVVIR